MAGVTPLRLRLGALLWLLTLQFFVVETVVQAQYELDYSRADDAISLLGSSASSAQAPAVPIATASVPVHWKRA